jgi:hypothetical protein
MSDNRYFQYGCPPLMNDGRFITNYGRSSTFDQYIRTLNNINSTHEYRHFIQNNGHNIINNMKAFHRENNTCSVEGKCLPIINQRNVLTTNEFYDGVVPPSTEKPDNKIIWYEELLDDENAKPIQLDFMMYNNNNNNEQEICTSEFCK